MKASTSPHPDLLAAQALAYAPCGYSFTHLQPEPESADYAACTLLLNGLRVQYRVAKITPTKVGQFVTFWKRLGRGSIQPFDVGDPVDLFVVSTRSGQQLGQFVFPKAVLADQGVVASGDLSGHQAGKRALRVYPPWDTTTSRQAQRTQAWQLRYFVDMSQGQAVDLERVQALLAQPG
nr:MepB family protein [uncultured Rhodoferax sp.]